MKFPRNALRILLLFVLVSFGTQLSAQQVTGILPDKSAKPGTWTEWQSVKDSTGAEIAQYRIRLKSSEKFVGSAVECKYEIEVKSLIDGMIFVDLDYSYDQVLNGHAKRDTGERSGSMMKKGKSWTFEFSAFTDKDKDEKDRTVPCFSCGLTYTLSFKANKY